MQDAQSEQWGFPQLRKLSLFWLVRIRCVVITEASVNPGWEKFICGEDKALESIADGTINTTAWMLDSLWRPATVTRLKGEFELEKCGLWHSHCLFCLWPSVGFLSTTVWAFDVTEVIVDYSLLSASIFIRASHGTQKRERQGLPFISTLIFLCDGWLSYCVICAFEKCSLEQKKLPSSKSYKHAQWSEERKKKSLCVGQRRLS